MLQINNFPYFDIPPKKEFDSTSYTQIGNGEKHIVILMQINKEEVKWTQENEDLLKIINAIKLNEKDYILGKSKDFTGFELNNIQYISKIEKVLLFGVDPKILFNGIGMEYLQIVPLLDFEVLSIPSIEILMQESNKALKSTLWAVLQVWFGLKK